jgi:hypothetical protein
VMVSGLSLPGSDEARLSVLGREREEDSEEGGVVVMA